MNEVVALAVSMSVGISGYIRKKMSHKKMLAYCV